MEKEAIREGLKAIKENIRTIKSEFSKKKQEKENQFSEGEKYSQEIKGFYDEVKEIEVSNNLDAINKDLEEKKADFEVHKKNLEEIEQKLNEVKSKPRPTYEGPRVKTISIERAKQEIKNLDTKLQTQVLSLDKESELLKKIVELKGILNSTAPTQQTPENNEFREVNREVKKIKRKYINAEKKIRSLYKQIRIISKDKKQKYKQIDELRDLKKKSFEGFRLTKKEYISLGKDLRDLYKKEEEILIQLGEAPSQRKEQFRRDFKEKQKEVEDKLMKKGGVLTTEDLLLFQKK